jgi:hypothetical protein
MIQYDIREDVKELETRHSLGKSKQKIQIEHRPRKNINVKTFKK